MHTSEISTEIVEKYPTNAWLQMKMAELDMEIAESHHDRVRLITELSKARDMINRLRAGLD